MKSTFFSLTAVVAGVNKSLEGIDRIEIPGDCEIWGIFVNSKCCAFLQPLPPPGTMTPLVTLAVRSQHYRPDAAIVVIPLCCGQYPEKFQKELREKTYGRKLVFLQSPNVHGRNELGAQQIETLGILTAHWLIKNNMAKLVPR